jgi:CMP/dCMP kinase
MSEPSYPLPVIAVDGLAASGKGTLAKKLAADLGFDHLDTGVLYRGVAYYTLERHIAPHDQAAVVALARGLTIKDFLALVHDVKIRHENVSASASVVAAIPDVRAALLDLQRHFATTPPGQRGAVLDGRDIGTVICPAAPVKFFVTAPLKTRAYRRYKELQGRGEHATDTAVFADMQIRDERDQTRAIAATKPAEGAIVIDTEHLDAEATFALARQKVREKIGL